MLADRMRYLRRILRLNQKDLASMLGMGRSQLSMVENNTAGMSARTAVLIEKLFGLSQDWLMTGTGPMFLDWELGVKTLANAGRITRQEEMLFLAELAQHFYFLNHDRPVKGSIVRMYLELLDFLMPRAKNLNELDMGKDLPSPAPTLPEKIDELRDFLGQGKCESSVADMVLRELVYLLREGAFDLKENEIDLINGMIMPRALWVAKKAIHPDTAPVDPDILRAAKISERRLWIQQESFLFDGFLKPEPVDLVCSLVYSRNDMTVRFLMDFKSLYELLYCVTTLKDSEIMRAGEWELFRENTRFSMQLGKCSISWNDESDNANLREIVKRIRAEKDAFDAITQRYLQEFGTY